MAAAAAAGAAAAASAAAPTPPARISFGPPAKIAHHVFWPVAFVGFGDGRHAIGRGDAAWYGTSDSGRSWTELPSFKGVKASEQVISANGGQQLHDFGTVTSVHDRNGSFTNFSSTMATYFSSSPFAASMHRTAVEFRGLPQPATCGDARFAFGCPFRLAGGSVRLNDGTLVISAIVYWGPPRGNPNPKLASEATSVVAFRATDGIGLLWEYAGIIIDAHAASSSEEGPNESALAMLADGSILAVVRLDAGDGPATHPFLPYARSVSVDGGRTWSAAVALVDELGHNIGCARPRLLTMPSGAVLLSGGRLHRGNWDTYVWLNAAGDGKAWSAHSVSYWHNVMQTNASLRFPPSVNASASRISTSYTSLVATGAASGFVVYSRTEPSPSVGFAMPFTLT